MWDPVIQTHKRLIQESWTKLSEHKAAGCKGLMMQLLARFMLFVSWATWRHELLSLEAQLDDVPAWGLALMQMVYELSAHCTSAAVCAPAADGTTAPYLVRAMDWEMSFDLRPLTIDIEFQMQG